MSDATVTFGARYAELGSVGERLALEAEEDGRAAFAAADAVLETLIGGALRGERVAKLVPARRKRDADSVELNVELTAEERSALAEHFEVAQQEKRGSWYVPEDEVLSLGLIHLVHWMRRNSRLALNMADGERARPLFRGAPEAVAVWVLEPLFEELFLPLKLRGLSWLGKRTVEQQEKSWAVIDPLYAALGIDPEPLDRFRVATGWSRHTTEDVIALRQALVESWTRVADAAARYRTYRVGQLVERYYAKAKNGQALRKSVLTKAHGRTLTAYFGGDWLAFLAYLGEEVHPREEIVQALPDTKLMVGGSARAAQVAAEHGLPAEEVQKMLAAFWQQSDHASPVEQRVDVLKRFWAEFDGLHARQASGMRSLWGLVQEHSYVHPRLDGGADSAEGDDDGQGDGVFAPRLYEELLSPELNADIERLWGTAVLPRWPDRLVTEPAPHARLSDAFGPALRFWEGAALTAWFLCEGPYSRTDIDGLANYHHRELETLNELGCPVGGELFRELREAEQRYGAPEHGTGLTITISISLFGDDDREKEPHVRFEQLRDIITRHRRAWAEQYLDRYLRSRWELELRAAAEDYHRHAAEKGKPPTLKQFAKLAAPEANQWFGGDLTGIYGALGLRAPAAPTRAPRLVPRDPDGFATRLYERLRGEPYRLPPSWKEDGSERERHNNFTALAGMCVEYLQLEEALGESPELKVFGRQKFTYRSSVLSDDPEEAWRLYSRAVHDVLDGPARERIPGARSVTPAEESREGQSPVWLPPEAPTPPRARDEHEAAPRSATEPEKSGALGRALGRLRGRR